RTPLTVVLFLARAVMDIAVAAGELSLGERRLCLGDDVVGSQVVAYRRAADRNGGKDASVFRGDGSSAERRQDFVRGPRRVLRRAMRQQYAKSISAQSADVIADAH